MANIIVKKSEHHVDPKDPKTHPDYQRALVAGKIMAPQLKFENEGAKRDYARAVESNPNNIYGQPVFYPALQIREVVRMEQSESAKRVEEFRDVLNNDDLPLMCNSCKAITMHYVTQDNSLYCGACKTKSKFRKVAR